MNVLRWLLDWVIRMWRSAPCEDSPPDRRLLMNLRRRIRRYWGLPIILLIVTGCSQTRTVYVPHGQPVRLRETIRSAKVWVLDGSGQPVAGVIDLPEGWYALPYVEQPE